MGVCGPSLFGSGYNYIKVGNGEFLAVEGSNISERLSVSNIRIPYKQILKGKVVLKEGQSNYLLNHLGLGDNSTFLVIKATYDSKSVIEEDNYVNWTFYDEITSLHSFAQLLVLTGNSTNRIKQLYLSNPNTKYKVILDVMIGIIDEEYSYFNNTDQGSYTFTNLTIDSIRTHIQGQSIVIIDSSNRPLVYINISNIESIEKIGTILLINDSSMGGIYLHFNSEEDTYQSQSLFNYILENPNININTIDPIEDLIPPIIYFNEKSGQYGDYISLNGSTMSVPYNTSQGITFSTSISLSSLGGQITLDDINDLLIDRVVDNRDNLIELSNNNFILNNESSEQIININSLGDYTLKFNIKDIANNNLDNIIMNINIIE